MKRFLFILACFACLLACKREVLYKKYLQDLCAEGGDFHYKTAMARIKAWQNTVAPYVSNDTNEDMVIGDQLPDWCDYQLGYRVMEEGANNFFQVKAATVNKM